ncbi:hypothetical protein L0Y69_00300, partial [bacterium]|nr:hypothetical protein [bacterium]
MSRILAIETSCDETAISIIEMRPRGVKILANALISQIEIHKPYGGVFPMLAKREHKKNLPILLEQALKEWGAKNKKGKKNSEREREELVKKIDLIAVTHGPGLEPALWEGITFAEELGRMWKKPVMPINHMEGHIVAGLFSGLGSSPSSRLYPPSAGPTPTRQRNFPSRVSHIQTPKFPTLALLISGAHTELVLMEDWFKYKMLGETRDDAVGEAFDKVARTLGLPYPGGPEISQLAEEFRATHPTGALPSKGVGGQRGLYQLPRPMLHSRDFDFSFSGLKTAVLYMVQKI